MDVTADKQYLDEVHFSARMEIASEYEGTLTNVLVDYEKGWPRRPIDLLGAEETENGVDLYHFTMESGEEGGETFVRVEMDYFQQTGKIRPRGRVQRERDLKGVQRILEVLETINIQCHFHCHVSWEFPRDRFSTMINLPLMNLHLPGVSLNKISGVRLSTPGGQNVILDQTFDESATTVTASFAFHGLWSKFIVQRVLQEGEKLIDRLVIEEPQETNNNDAQT